MRISRQKLSNLLNTKGLRLSGLLKKAHISKTAYYSILRKESVLPRSIVTMAETLGVRPSAILEEENSEEKKLRRIIGQTEKIVGANPLIDRDNVIHTLLLLHEKPIDRLARGIIRAKKFNFH